MMLGRATTILTRPLTSSSPRCALLLDQSQFRLYSSPSTAEALERAKVAAGFAAVESCLRREHEVIGIGSGSTVVAVVDALKQTLSEHKRRTFIPTSFQSRQLIIDAGLTLGNIEDTRRIDITFDGADDIDLALNAIKGGGACHLREKVVAELSAEFVLVADWRKQSSILGTGDWKRGVPLEVVPFAADFLLSRLRHSEEFGEAVVALRMGGGAKAGPVVTDNGNLVLDAVFSPALMRDPAQLLARLKALTGIVEVGLFVGMAQRAFIGLENGGVELLTPREAS